MAYTILNPDGTTLALLADGTIDQVTTSLTLIGKDYNSYGQYFNNNFNSPSYFDGSMTISLRVNGLIL